MGLRHPPIALTREEVSRFFCSEAPSYRYLSGVASLSFSWSFLTRVQITNITLYDLDFDLGLVWIRAKPFPLQPETRKFLLERWLPERRQAGEVQSLITDRWGKPFGLQSLTMEEATEAYFGCVIRSIDFRYSLPANLLAEGKSIVKFHQPIQQFMEMQERLGVPPCVQVRNFMA